MNALIDLFTTDCIALHSPAKNRPEAFAVAGALFGKRLDLSPEHIISFLDAREDLGSTALGAGVAIPHGRVKGLKEPVAALIRLTNPIEFAAPDGLPVSTLIFLLVPEKATQEHLEILSAIAQLISNSATRDKISKENNPEQVCRLLQEWSA